MKSSEGNNWDIYRSIAAFSEGLYKDKGSRFIAFAYPIESEDQVKPIVDEIKKEHHGARHHCFAYRIGCKGECFRANDDGEPSGSAGRQILGAIDSAGLSDVLVVVVRYFGGILLGVPGLIKAYKESTADALNAAQLIEKTAGCKLQLEFQYLEMNDVQKFVKAESVRVIDQKFDQECSMVISVRLTRTDDFIERINKLNDEKGTRIQCRPL